MTSADSQDSGNSAGNNRRQGSSPPGSSSLSSLFQRRNSLAVAPSGAGATPVYPSPAAAITADMNHRRRLSVTTGLGLSGTSPTSSYFRRGSMSASSGSDSIIDEHAVDEDEPMSAPVQAGAGASAFAPRASFGARAGVRASVPGPSSGAHGTPSRMDFPLADLPAGTGLSGSGAGAGTGTSNADRRSTTTTHSSVPTHSGPEPQSADPVPSGDGLTLAARIQAREARLRISRSGGGTTTDRAAGHLGLGRFPSNKSPVDQAAFDWNEQLQSRARARTQSSVVGPRPFFSSSPPNPVQAPVVQHVAAPEPEMPAPPTQPPVRARERPKPDYFQERILKGDFYMD